MTTNRRALFALILALTSGISACEQNDGPSQLTGPVTPQLLLSGEFRILKHTRTVITDKVCTPKPISYGGGALVFDGGYIQVSYLAVTSPTIFCAQNHPGTDDFRVDLTAYNAADGTVVSTFTAPVLLNLDISDVLGITDSSILSIVYLRPDGTLEPVPTAVDKKGKQLTATLSHFSDYAPAIN